MESGGPSRLITASLSIPESIVTGACARIGQAKSVARADMAITVVRVGRIVVPPLDSGVHARQDGFKNATAVARSEQRVHSALRVGHHAEDVSGFVADAGDGVHRPIGAPPYVGIG